MVILPIVVSSRTFLPDNDGGVFVTVAVVAGAVTATDTGAVDGAVVRVSATVVASGVGSAVATCVWEIPAGADWVHPAHSISAAARRPRIQSVRTGDILTLWVLQENRDYGAFISPFQQVFSLLS